MRLQGVEGRDVALSLSISSQGIAQSHESRLRFDAFSKRIYQLLKFHGDPLKDCKTC